MQVDYETLKKLKEFKILLNSLEFPSEDLIKMEDELIEDNEETSLTGDFDSYWSLVSGSLDYIMNNKKIPHKQKRLLDKDFFVHFPCYSNLKKQYHLFSDFKGCLKTLEDIRQLLLKI
ncbi:YxiJ-like family protein [Niallia sp. RD1]|uniref:YxiJ-like family protein n=1 Tax=Niallia sp. RD1 TaxID=2962858 RepID=UPI0020C1ADA1|nr:YxiJ-like family protein [Niallia sp. RD1]UTI43869.1 YxiJ-like family protein [Niallia sp. RD1]HWJ77571.1 YxiJ-like family protein [Niallia sp.]